MDAPFKKNGAYRLGKFEPRSRPDAAGAYAPPLTWRHYAALGLAPMCRPSSGALMPTPHWLHSAAP